MPLIVLLVIGAGILGLTIAIMERNGFPGWGTMIICVLAAIIPAFIINSLLPPPFFFVGLLIGAFCAGCAISALCGMSVKRATIAAGIYLGVQTLVSTALYLMIKTN